MKYLLFLLFIFNVVTFSQSSGSFGFTDATSLSLANTYIVRTQGIDAIGVNPANLAFQTYYSTSLRALFPIPSFNTKIALPMELDDYNYFFGGVPGPGNKTVGRPLSQEDKSRLIELLRDNNFLTNINLNYFSLAINFDSSFGAIAFSITDRAGQDFKISPSLVEFLFNGNKVVREYSLSEIYLNSIDYREYSLSYARLAYDKKLWIFNDIYAGVTLKYLTGFYYGKTVNNNSSIRFTENNSLEARWDYEVNFAVSKDFANNYGKDSISPIEDFSFSLFPSSAGSGFGFDIGLSATIDKIIRVGISLTDIGSINWNTNTSIIKGSGNLIFSGYSTEENIDSLISKLEKIENILGGEFSSTLPTCLRIGFSYQFDKAPFIKSFPGTLLISFDYNQGFNDALGNSTTPRFSLGLEWDPGKWIPYIRTGFSVGGKLGAEWAFGIGIDTGPLELNLGFLNPIALFSMNKITKGQFGMDSKWKF